MLDVPYFQLLTDIIYNEVYGGHISLYSIGFYPFNVIYRPHKARRMM